MVAPTVVLSLLLATPVAAQVLAALDGVVSDPSGAAVAGALVTAAQPDTGISRQTPTDEAGRYRLLQLPVGIYTVTVSKAGFRTALRTDVQLVVGQRATMDIVLEVGTVNTGVTVTAATPIVPSTTDVSGLVSEAELRGLPLNGRSYDLLTTLNPGVVNFTWEKTGGTGISNSTTANMFAVSGNRPQQNLFLLNGVEFTGAAENNMTPGGASGQLLGMDAVREFNVLRDTYGAAYGKKPGGQIAIVTQSGTNQWRGSGFEFGRMSALDAPNYFDAGNVPPPFSRNQFGASVGGPLRAGHAFLFLGYEGFIQNLHQTSVAFVPDAHSRTDAAPIVKTMGLLDLWPVAPPGSADFSVTPNGDGVAEVTSSPLQTIREHFGTTRLDRAMTARNSLSAVYTIDDSRSKTATPLDPYSTDILSLGEQVLSIQDTHAFSSRLLNTARFGFSRAGYFFTGEPTPGTPAAAVPGFLAGHPAGALVVGGSQASNPQAQLGLAGSNNGSNLRIGRNLFTVSNDLVTSRGAHEISAGVWVQPFQSNEMLALSQYGQLTFTGLPNFLAGTASFLYDPAPTLMHWRSVFAAAYVEDVYRARRSLTLSLGFRDEFGSGWHEATGRAASYALGSAGPICASQPAPNVCLPTVAKALFTQNRAAFLPEPRLAAAWRTPGGNTVVRAGAGVYRDLQDALGYRADQNGPSNPTYTIAATSLANIFGAGGTPIQPGAPPPVSPLALLTPGGVQPDLRVPTLIQYSVRVERSLPGRTTLTVGYVGGRGYHEIIGVDTNAPRPVVCPASPCPSTFPITVDPSTGLPAFGALAGQPVPAGTFFTPSSAKPNPLLANSWTWMSKGRSRYDALQIDMDRRLSGSMQVRGVYTLARAMDDGDSLNATAAGNAVALLSNPYDPMADWGPATYDVRHAASISALWLLPWRGCGLARGWTLTSVVTAQSGFPFTPQLAYNPANNGDSRNPVRPFVNPAFTGPVVTGNPSQWFNPAAFIAPPSTSGFYGDVTRDAYRGPGLATWDASVFKDTALSHRATLQVRLEIFNLLNRANFNTPNLITHILQAPPHATFSEPSPTAGHITSTATSSRQIQIAAKVVW